MTRHLAPVRTSARPALWGALALAATLAVGGCASDDRNPRRDDYAGAGFFHDDEANGVDAVVAAQTAKGAANDAMLHPVHFDRGRLNALGRDKLGRIVSARHDGESVTTVYLDLPPSDDPALAAERRRAVADRLASAGLSAGQFELVDGPNASRPTYAAENLARAAKTESPRGGPAAGGSSLFGSVVE